MPNTGRPSPYCYECRQRRMKCDLGRPQCNRCLKGGRPCPGYRNELDLRFRTENISSLPFNMRRDCRKRRNREGTSPKPSEKRRQNVAMVLPIKKRAAQLTPAQMHYAAFVLAGITANAGPMHRWADIFDKPDDFLPLVEPQSPPLHYPLAESWNDHIMPMIMDKFSFEMENGEIQCVFKPIPHVLAKTKDGSLLYLACNAVCHAYMAKATSKTGIFSNAARSYGIALAAVNQAIRDPRQCKSDDTLMAVWLLSLYELLSGVRGDGSSEIESSGWDIHSGGLSELLRVRGSEQFTNEGSRNLFWVVFSTVQTQSLITGHECPKDTITWIRELYRHCEPSERLVLRTIIYSYHCAQLCSQIRKLVNAGDVNELLSSSPSVLRDMEELESVTYPLSHEKDIQDYVIKPPRSADFSPEDVDIRLICAESYQISFRMRVSYHVLELLILASKAPGCTLQQRETFAQHRRRCIEDFRALSNKVLSMLPMTLDAGSVRLFETMQGPKDQKRIPRVMGWSDAMRILWPLQLIVSCPISLYRQKDAANKVLDMMSSQMGVVRALETLYLSTTQVR